MGSETAPRAEAAALERALSRLALRRHVLPNGMRVLVCPTPSRGRVSCRLLYRVGAADDPSEATGLSHLLEHLMFKGTHRLGVRDAALDVRLQAELEALRRAGAHAPQAGAALRARFERLREAERDNLVRDELWRLYLEAGATDLNAYTSDDATLYTVTLPPEALELMCAIEAERMAHAVLREFDTERQVILEERRLESSQPERRYAEALRELHYRGTPYRWPVTGYAEHIARVELRTLERHYARHYVPERAILVLVGDCDPDRAVACAQRHFGELQRRRDTEQAPPRASAAVASFSAWRGERPLGAARLLGRGRCRARVTLLFPAPTFADRDAVYADVLTAILDGAHGLLFTELVERRALALEAGMHYDAQVRDSALALEALPRPGVSCEQLEHAMWEVIAQVCERGVEPAALVRGKRLLAAGFVAALEDDAQLAARLAWWEAFGGGIEALERLPGRWAEVHAHGLAAFCRRLFDRERVTIGRFVHEEGERLELHAHAVPSARPIALRALAEDTLSPRAASALAGARPPRARERSGGGGPLAPNWFRRWRRASRALSLPKLERHAFALFGGRLRAVFVHDPHLPVVRLDLFVRRGEIHVPKHLRGLGALTARMMREGGAGAYDAQALEAQLADLAAVIDLETGLEFTHLELWSLAPLFERTLRCLADIVLRPRWCARRFERFRAEMIEELRHRDLEPENALGRRLRERIYGDHPAAWRKERETIEAITLDALARLHAETFVPEHMVLALSGDLDLERFVPLFERELAPLAERMPPPAAPPLPRPVPRPHPELLVLEHPGAETAIEWVAPAVDRLHPDVLALSVLDQLLGGESFTSRIPVRVRGEEGLAYGAGSYFVPRLFVPGVFGLYVQCAPERAARVARILSDELQRAREQAPAAAALERAVRRVRDGLAHRIATPHARALCLAELLLAQAPSDHLERLLERLEGLEPEMVRAAAARYLAPERMVRAVLGPVGRLLGPDPVTGERLEAIGPIVRETLRLGGEQRRGG